MNTDKSQIDNDLTNTIIGCAFTVSNTLGTGFLEKVYENALAIELGKNKLAYQQQYPIKVTYDDIIVGEYISDLIVESKVLIELKASKCIDDTHLAQCLNYLKATNIRFGLIINFGKPKVEIKRVALGF
ncbi:MAG: GxxExxY protein [Methylotenera sp.]|jgi:GxxExxY protein|nr:GxxExxY protein [Methylotenera sp.]